MKKVATMRRKGAAALLTCIAIPAACADLAIEPNQVPHSMVITPADTLVTEGDQAKLTLTVRDIDLNPIPGPPSWAAAEWDIKPTPQSIDIAPDGSLSALGGGDLQVIARAAGLEAWTTLRINPANIQAARFGDLLQPGDPRCRRGSHHRRSGRLPQDLRNR